MTPVVSKLLAVATTLGLAILCWFSVIEPLSTWRSDTLGNLQNAVTDESRLRAAISKMELEKAQFGTGSDDVLTWSASQTGEAFARVQASLSETASANGISFRSITPLPTAEIDGLTRAPVRVEFEADLSQLSSFLQSVEYGIPALPIERAMLRRLIRPNETASLPVLFVQLDVAAPISVVETQ